VKCAQCKREYNGTDKGWKVVSALEEGSTFKKVLCSSKCLAAWAEFVVKASRAFDRSFGVKS